MSELTLKRIQDRTARQLAAFSGPEAVQVIADRHFRDVAADLAEALFLRVTSTPGFDNPQINTAILNTLGGLIQSVRESFAAHGLAGSAAEERACTISNDSFLDRMEALFAVPESGGRA